MSQTPFKDIVMLPVVDRIRSWRIGQVKITKIVETEMLRSVKGGFPNAESEGVDEIDWLRPQFVSADGRLRFSFHALVIETSSRRIVVDTCFGNDKQRSAAPFSANLQLPFLRDLETAGYDRGEIDTVVCTHLHADHIGWNTMLVDGRWTPTFPNARYLITRAEFEHWRSELDAQDKVMAAIFKESFDDSIQPVLDAGLLDLVSPHHRLCDEIRLMATPGHTPGHVSVVITSEGQAAIITGDSIHHPCQLVHTHWSPGVDHDAAQAEGTRRQILADLADTPTLVIGTHWAGATAGHVIRDGEHYRLAT